MGPQKVTLEREHLSPAVLTEGSVLRCLAKLWGYCGQEKGPSKEVMFEPIAERQGKASHTVLGRGRISSSS